MKFKNKLFAADVKKTRGNWSLRKAAKIVGISYASLSRIENGKTPSLISYMKVCDMFYLNSKQYFYQKK